jgi:hypothetical protein
MTPTESDERYEVVVKHAVKGVLHMGRCQPSVRAYKVWLNTLSHRVTTLAEGRPGVGSLRLPKHAFLPGLARVQDRRERAAATPRDTVTQGGSQCLGVTGA